MTLYKEERARGRRSSHVSREPRATLPSVGRDRLRRPGALGAQEPGLLRAELAVRLGWLSEGQLLDAVAVGQVTPGPLFTTATFVGYVLGGHAGAGAATGLLLGLLR